MFQLELFLYLRVQGLWNQVRVHLELNLAVHDLSQSIQHVLALFIDAKPPIRLFVLLLPDVLCLILEVVLVSLRLLKSYGVSLLVDHGRFTKEVQTVLWVRS